LILPSTGGGEHEPGRLAGSATGIGRLEGAQSIAKHEKNATTVRRPSQAKPSSWRDQGEQMRKKALRDLNHVDSDSYMPGIRRSRE
jgi:hypothetical protein